MKQKTKSGKSVATPPQPTQQDRDALTNFIMGGTILNFFLPAIAFYFRKSLFPLALGMAIVFSALNMLTLWYLKKKQSS